MPRVTVGVSTYNRQGYLRECLQALEKQTYRDFEIIVVDDGSTDGTDELMVREFPRVRYCYKPNGGDASAKNLAAGRSDSEFLSYCDSDDLYLPDALERLIEPLLDRPRDCSYGQYVRIDSAGNELPTRRKLDHFPSGRILAPMVERILVPGSGFMLPRRSVLDCGGFDESMRVGHDYQLMLKLARRCEFHALNRVISKRRRHDGNLSSATYDKTKRLRDLVAAFCAECAGEPDLTSRVVNRRLARYELALAREARREKLPREAVKRHLAAALRRDFTLKALLRRLFW